MNTGILSLYSGEELRVSNSTKIILETTELYSVQKLKRKNALI